MAQNTIINKDLTISDSTVTLGSLLKVQVPSITASCPNASQSLTISSNYGQAQVPLVLSNGCNYSDYFSVSDNKITVISNKIKKVLITGGLMNYRGSSGYISTYIRKNGDAIAIGRCGFTDWTSESMTTAPQIIEVQSGDYFTLHLGGSVSGTYQLSYATQTCLITIMAIEYDLD